MNFKNLYLILIVFVLSGYSNASSLTALQECQSIKNSARRADCYDKQTKKIIQEQNDKKKNEELAKIEAENIKAEEARKATEDAKKAAEDAKKIADEKLKIEKAQKVLQIVKRLQTRVETGVSYRDYSSVISDPKFEVRSYIGENINDFPDFSRHLLKAISYYDAAGAIWGLKFKNQSGRLSEITCGSDVMNTVTNMLDGAYIRRSVTLMCGEGLLISDAVSTAWTKASESIREASNSLVAK